VGLTEFNTVCASQSSRAHAGAHTRQAKERAQSCFCELRIF